MRSLWNRLTAGEETDALWELFHENSKTSRFDAPLPTAEIIERMNALWQALPYDERPPVDLPHQALPLDMTIGEAIVRRVTARRLQRRRLSLAELATLLGYAYGLTRSNEGSVFPRPFRTVPSGGALYPLELFIHATDVEALRPGLYHYNPLATNLRLLREGDDTRRFSTALVQPELAVDTSVLILVTAIFERSTFKYGDRGYRFTLLEAGHVAQNLNLVATALDLGVVNIGGYFDRDVDAIVGIDGVTHSTIYMMGIGQHAPGQEDQAIP